MPCASTGRRRGHGQALFPGATYAAARRTGTGKAAVSSKPGLREDAEKIGAKLSRATRHSEGAGSASFSFFLPSLSLNSTRMRGIKNGSTRICSGEFLIALLDVMVDSYVQIQHSTMPGDVTP